MSDNSFFPPLRKVQNCIVLKAKYESQRQVAGRKGRVAGNCHSVVARKPQSLGSEVEKPTRKCHARIFPLHTEERLRVGGATKCRN